jgi:type I restriction enzyme M protein
MLSKISTAGQNGQFRTPRHIIKLIVEMVEVKPTDAICDPACGTAGFLIAAAEYLREHHPEALRDDKLRYHFHNSMFNGFDFDSTMLRIGSMNMLLHGIENSAIAYRDSLAQEHSGETEKYTLVLANPPFSGSLAYESTAKDLLEVVRTRKTELLFLALFLRLLKPGGRAAVIVPAGVLEADSTAHAVMRKKLIEENNLEAIIALPHWIFKPYASVSTAIMVFGKGGPTKSVWFYKLENDGFNNDAAKTPREGSEIPDLLQSWTTRHSKSYRPVSKKHCLVSKDAIAANDYDLCERVYLSGYKYPKNVPLRTIEEMFDVSRGTFGAADATDGPYPFITSSEDPKTHTDYSFDSEAICIPIVSSTGHGHASIKRIHYAYGKFAAATITAVLLPKSSAVDEVYVPYVYYYLFSHKDELLVPLMRGAANISLNMDRLKRLRVPVPKRLVDQKRLVADLWTIENKISHLRGLISKSANVFAEKLDKFGRVF